MIESLQKPESDNAWADLRAAVHRFVARRVRDAHASEDIVQDVMLKIRQHLAPGRAKGQLAPWVFRVARNAVIDHYRAAAAQGAVSVDEAADVPEDPKRESPVAELSRCVGRLIPRLPEPYQQALRLADLEGRSQQEVADTMGIKLSAAKSRVQRAREKLHAMLLDCCKVELTQAGAVLDYQTTPRSGSYCGGSDCDSRNHPGGCR